MATISENLEALKSVKEDIKSAIEGKGQDLTNVPFTEYSNKINEITTKEDLDAELDEQEALLVDLRTKVNELPNKPDIDLSQTTATAEDVFQGKQFYNAQGELAEGTYKDMLQRKVDATKSCEKLFENFPDEDMSWVNKLDTSQVTTLKSMFSKCSKAKTLNVSNYDTSNVEKMESFCTNCSSLEKIIGLENFNVQNVKSMYQMFYWCQKLKEVDVSTWRTVSLERAEHIFSYCWSLTYLNLSNFDFSKVSGISYAFYQCKALETIVGNIDLVNVSEAYNIIHSCNALKDVTFKNIRLSLSMGSGTGEYSWDWGHLLTNETLINTIQELWDNTDNALGGSRTLTLSTTSKTNISNIYVKLIDVTDDMIANDPYITNKKPCVVCESTDEGAMTLTEYAIGKGWSIA